MGDACGGGCTCERGNALASLAMSLATLIADLRAQVADLQAKSRTDLAELERIRSEFPAQGVVP